MSTDFLEQIERIKRATLDGKITWQKSGTNIYVWFIIDQHNRKVNAVLQKFNKGEKEIVLFRLWDPERKVALLEQISDQVEPKYAEGILGLYNFVDELYRNPGLSYLDEVLDNIS